MEVHMTKATNLIEKYCNGFLTPATFSSYSARILVSNMEGSKIKCASQLSNKLKGEYAHILRQENCFMVHFKLHKERRCPFIEVVHGIFNFWAAASLDRFSLACHDQLICIRKRKHIHIRYMQYDASKY